MVCKNSDTIAAWAIEYYLDKTFPSGGKNEDVINLQERCENLRSSLEEHWDELPKTLQKKVRKIELEVCKRQQLTLHVNS